MQKLEPLAVGRDNNLQLIRILAAWAVMFSHGFAISLGIDAAEPGRVAISLTAGDVAVDIFFIISGFLVTGSLLSRSSVLDFAWSRILRIYPALIAMTMLLTFGLGVLMTVDTVRAYFTDPLTAKFLLKNITVFAGVGNYLPGVFEDVPYRHEVNASLWTLFYEVTMYELLAVAWLLSRFVSRKLGREEHGFFRRVIGVIALCAASAYLGLHFMEPGWRPFARLSFFFFSGACFYVYRQRVALGTPLFLAVGSAIALSLPWPQLFFPLYTLGLPYLVFYLVYVPAGPIRAYNKLGDYSYGVYILAYPIQQTIVSFHPGISPVQLIFYATLLTLPLAMLSWEFIERPALSLKQGAINLTRLKFGSG